MLFCSVQFCFVLYTCCHCSEKFKSVLLYNKHQKQHSNLPIKCQYSFCLRTFKNYSSFKQHNLRSHKTNGHFSCKYKNCSFRCFQSKKLREHFLLHASTALKSISCSFCDGRVLKNEKAFNVHVSSYHKNDFYKKNFISKLSEIVKSQENDCVQRCDDKLYAIGSDNSRICGSSNVCASENVEPETYNVQNAEKKSTACIYSEMYLKIITKHSATEPLVQKVVNCTSKAYQHCSVDFENSEMASELPGNVKDTIMAMFSKSFQGIKRTHVLKQGVLRSKFSRQNFTNKIINTHSLSQLH